MSKVYIIYYDFSHTSRNHAGMSHLVKFLDAEMNNVILVKNIHQQYRLGSYVGRIYAVLLAFYLFFKVGKNDKIFFFEYLTKGFAYQDLTARVLRFMGRKQYFYGLVHLAGSHLLELYRDESTILKRANLLDRIFVFGSSLQSFLYDIGYQREVVNTFHYVDTNFYRPIKKPIAHHTLQVICIGNLKRNYGLLKDIVTHCRNIQFHICMGKSDLSLLFQGIANVKLYGFLEEYELLQLMQECDVNLSVLEDTIGSNVITTALATGLVQVVSEVGSIKDYCHVNNSFLCRNLLDFTNAINVLDNNRDLLCQMQMEAGYNATLISKEAFLVEFKEFVK